MNDRHYDISYQFSGIKKDINNQYEDKAIDYYLPSTASLIPVNNTIIQTEAKLHGNWNIDDFIDGPHSEPALVTFTDGGVGTAVISDEAYSLTWQINASQLTVSVPDYEHTTTDINGIETLHIGLTNQYWFIKQSDVLSQTISLSANGKTSSALFVKNQPNLAFTHEDAVGGWLFHNGRTIYRYDLYEDGSFIPDWNWEGNPYKWSITDNGEMLRERERCDFTYDGKEVCFTYQKVYHKKLAEEGEFFYVSREFQQYWLNYDSGIVEFNNSFKSILVYEKSNHYGHTQFSDWAQGRYFYAMSAEDPRASITKVEFTSPGNGSWSYDEVPKDENGYFIVKEYTDTTSNIQFTPYKFSGGSIIFNSFDNDKEMRFSIIAHERDFYTVCHYEVGANIQEIQSCSTGELLYFFDEASTAEAMQGTPLINKQKFIDKKVYNFGSQGGKNTDVTVMEMANDGTVILKEQDGTSFSGKFSFVDNQVISFNAPTEGEDWDTFAVITGYNLSLIHI